MALRAINKPSHHNAIFHYLREIVEIYGDDFLELKIRNSNKKQIN